jgi:hypothetical protein
MKNLIDMYKKYIVHISIFTLSFLPLIYTWNNLPIWGDTMTPLSVNGLYKFLYQWKTLDNGQYLVHNYWPYLFMYKLFDFLGINIYLGSGIILATLKLIGSYGVCQLLKVIFNLKNQYLLLSVLFYLLSPSLLNASYYLYSYAFSPWLLYFTYRAIKKNHIDLSDICGISGCIFFISINLPNPKYIFHIVFIASLLIIFSLYFRKIKFNFFSKNIIALLLLVGINFYLLIPQIIFFKYYSPTLYDVHIKSEYKDSGAMMDYGESDLRRIFKLHKDTLNLNEAPKNSYNKNILVTISNYFTIFIVIFLYFLNSQNSQKRKEYLIIFNLLLIYIFFGAGPNPPFGFLYESAVERFQSIAFLRTTAGATFFMSILISLLLSQMAYLQNNKIYRNLYIIIFLSIIINGYPILSGETYKNVFVFQQSNVNTDRSGIVIPDEYFQAETLISQFHDDRKILFVTPQYSYSINSWGYFGAPIYSFIYTKDLLDCQRIYDPIFSNIGYIFTDKTSALALPCNFTIKTGSKLLDNSILKLESIPSANSLPHFYIPRLLLSKDDFINSKNDRIIQSIPAILPNEYLIKYSKYIGSSKSSIEYKKFNQSSFLVQLRNVPSFLPLAFTENFHPGWKVSLVPLSKDNDISSNKNFISNPSFGVVQNDNLKNVSFFDYFNSIPSNDIEHSRVNISSNIWFLNISSICNDQLYCQKNSDGSFNLNLLVKFQPDLFYSIAIAISFLLLAFAIIFQKTLFRK